MQLFAQVLRDPSAGAFDSVEIVRDADAGTVRRRLVDFSGVADEHEQIVVHVSGHGTAGGDDGRFFFATTDTDPDRLEDTAVSSEFVDEQLEQCSAAQKIAVLDRCESSGSRPG